MKLKNAKEQPDGTIKVSVCMCKGNKSTCEPKDRPVKTFKSKETLKKFEKSFAVKSLKK